MSDLVAESLMFNVLGGMLCFLFGCSGLANVDILRVTDSRVYITYILPRYACSTSRSRSREGLRRVRPMSPERRMSMWDCILRIAYQPCHCLLFRLLS